MRKFFTNIRKKLYHINIEKKIISMIVILKSYYFFFFNIINEKANPYYIYKFILCIG